MLGHELRNPMAAIRNALWVLDQVGSQDEQEVRQREIIMRQTRHLVRMVDDLLDVSRVTLGKIILQRRPVDLRDVVERCLAELGMAALARGNGLELAVDARPVLVMGDPGAARAGASATCSRTPSSTPRAAGGCRISVRRRGRRGGGAGARHRRRPLARDAARRSSSRSPRWSSSRQRSEGGLGLGLPLVRSLVEMHGGRVEAAATGLGKGSEFIVRLPLLRRRTRRKAPAAARRRPPASHGGRGQPRARTILVVEDNDDGRESLRELLEIWGHEVAVAENGPEGSRWPSPSRPEVALVDIGLPGLDGNEVARRIRSAPRRDEISLIAMTGYGQPEDRRRALQAGFDRYLVKPVDPAVLSQLLARGAPHASTVEGLRRRASVTSTNGSRLVLMMSCTLAPTL